MRGEESLIGSMRILRCARNDRWKGRCQAKTYPRKIPRGRPCFSCNPLSYVWTGWIFRYLL